MRFWAMSFIGAYLACRCVSLCPCCFTAGQEYPDTDEFTFATTRRDGWTMCRCWRWTRRLLYAPAQSHLSGHDCSWWELRNFPDVIENSMSASKRLFRRDPDASNPVVMNVTRSAISTGH